MSTGASQYIRLPGQFTQPAFGNVKSLNSITFLFGERDTNTTGTTIYFEYRFPFPVGTDSTGNHRPTNINSLILDGDCKTVRTSHPGTAIH